MFGAHHIEWSHNKIKAIIDFYGYKFFHQKRILDLGSGHGEIAAAFARLGADITCVDARQENIDIINKNYPHIKVICMDIDTYWPFDDNSYDMVFSLGILCHIKDYEKHIQNICMVADHVILETEVLDSKDKNLKIQIIEDKNSNDLSFLGEGSIVSPENICDKISKFSTSITRLDHGKINSGQLKYDWKENDSGIRTYGNRRFFFIKRDFALATQFANNQAMRQAEEEIRKFRIDIQQKEHEYRLKKQQYSHQPKIITSHIARQAYQQSQRTNLFTGPHKTIRLFLNYYEDKNPSRKAELDFCLRKNIDNNFLNVIIVESEINPTFNFLFEKINQISNEDDISIICNSDIYFDQTISLASRIGNDEAYALTRWNCLGGLPRFANFDYSQDAWIIKGKPKNIKGDYSLGKPGCDNRIAYELNAAGYKVSNPSLSIKAYHMHNSNIRHYSETDRINGEYLYVKPTALL